VENYCAIYKPQRLLYANAENNDINYGASKGLSFDRVLILPTVKIKEYLKNGDLGNIESVKAKFYVALTRARFSVGIVCDYDSGDYIEGVEKYIASSTS
jgi:DNA helicase-2/ATP-dependent DNA helicase PcrA